MLLNKTMNFTILWWEGWWLLAVVMLVVTISRPEPRLNLRGGRPTKDVGHVSWGQDINLLSLHGQPNTSSSRAYRAIISLSSAFSLLVSALTEREDRGWMGMLCLNFSLFESAIFAFLMHTVILAIYWICIVRVECPMPGCTRGCTLLFCIVLLIWNFEDKPEAWAGQTSKPCLTMFKMKRVQKSICLKA